MLQARYLDFVAFDAVFATLVSFAAFVSFAVLASIHCCNCRVDIAAFVSSWSLLSISLACNSFTKSRISDPEKVSIWPDTLISSCARVINPQSNPLIFLFRILLDIRVFGASSLADFVPFIYTPYLMSFCGFGVLHLQQFVSYAAIVTYYNSGGDVASAVFILLCLQYAVDAKNPLPSDKGFLCCSCNISVCKTIPFNHKNYIR